MSQDLLGDKWASAQYDRVMRSSSSVGETLVASLHAGPSTTPRLRHLLAEVDWDELRTAAEFHGVENWVYAAAARASSAPALVAGFEAARLRQDLLRAQVVADLSLAAASLNGASIPWLAFKGPVLDEVIHRPPRLRSYGDLDLLVSVRSLGQALEVLEQTGAVVLDKNWAHLSQDHSGQLHVRLTHGTLADLHWHFVNQGSDQSRFRIDIDDVLARRRMVRIGELDIPTLDAVDTVVHVAIHAAHHGGDRLLWLKDIEQCVLNETPPWDAIAARCDEWGVGVAVATLLARTRRVLGLALPDQVLHSLGYRPPWSTLTRTLDRLAPTESALGDRSLARMTAGVASGDQKQSFVTFTRRSAWILAHWSSARTRPRDPEDQSYPLQATGGSDGRAQYLAAIERAGTEAGVANAAMHKDVRRSSRRSGG